MGGAVLIADVFKSTGQPTITYVERDEGKYERALTAAVDAHGQLCLITGPSKTGKTTLYKRVLETKRRSAIIVRCDNGLTPIEFWRRSLEHVNFAQIITSQSSTAGTAEIATTASGTLGWKWLAGLSGGISGKASGTLTDGEVRQKILASPSPQHLIPVLRELPVTLVVEDFHYMDEYVQKIIFQQWKSFIDNEISVIVLGTTHHAVDIAYSNRDLIGRISQIDMGRWEESDLRKIMNKGFTHLGVNFDEALKGTVARESVGLPIVTQQTCEQLFIDKRISSFSRGSSVCFAIDDVYSAFHNLATIRYGQLESYYRTITTGPRRRARKYNTYELIMTCFAQEPVSFSLARHEIDKRLRKLPISGSEMPPAGSLTSTFKALEKFQASSGIELLEWRANERTLYIIEPSFLFYLRWRERRDTETKKKGSGLAELLQEIEKLMGGFRADRS